ncbi:MAG TPA: cupin domain-containing protein [Acidobacteriaceae bacterium]|nr:cupin domain-containing protein [Acidobacteriaceae bacterium]
MRRVLLLIALVLIAGPCRVGAVAQDPTITLPKNYRKVLDNPDVVVLRVHYGPHEQVPVHDHSDHPTIYVYLDDSGPVRFVHEPENVILTRPPTHTGSYRVSPGRRERHSLVNLSDKPTDYLRVELKKVPLGTLKGEFRGSAPERLVQGTKVEFADPALRIERVICDPRGSCLLPEESAPSVLVAFSPSELREGRRRQAFPEESSTLWLPAGKGAKVKAMGASPAHLLRIVLPAR